MDEKTIKEKKKELLKIIITARNLAENGDEAEAIALLDSKKLGSVYYELFFSDKTNKYDRLRNAVKYMCMIVEGSENAKKRAAAVKEAGKKESLRLIAEISEELKY